MRVTKMLCDRCETETSDLYEIEIKVSDAPSAKIELAFKRTAAYPYRETEDGWAESPVFRAELCGPCFDRLTEALELPVTVLESRAGGTSS